MHNICIAAVQKRNRRDFVEEDNFILGVEPKFESAKKPKIEPGLKVKIEPGIKPKIEPAKPRKITMSIQVPKSLGMFFLKVHKLYNEIKIDSYFVSVVRQERVGLATLNKVPKIEPPMVVMVNVDRRQIKVDHDYCNNEAAEEIIDEDENSVEIVDQYEIDPFIEEIYETDPIGKLLNFFA